MTEGLHASEAGGLLTLAFDRPAARNALTEAMRAGLIAALAAAAATPRIRGVILTGTGGAFCAGQDRAVLRDLTPGNVEAWVRGLGALYDALRRFPKPLVAAIPGAAAGAGLQMALCCDRRIAAPAARLLQPEIRAGVASVMGPFLIGLHAPLSVVQRLALACETLPAEEALAAGLLDEIVPETRLETRAHEVALALAQAEPRAYAATRAWLAEQSEAGFRAAIDAGVRLQRALLQDGAKAASRSPSVTTESAVETSTVAPERSAPEA
jgi:enoyl-CoA hydratase/carnithine racemase